MNIYIYIYSIWALQGTQRGGSGGCLVTTFGENEEAPLRLTSHVRLKQLRAVRSFAPPTAPCETYPALISECKSRHGLLSWSTLMFARQRGATMRVVTALA